MEYLFSTRGHAELARLAASNVLLAFDYDGTLSPIVPDPGRAILRPSTFELLRELAALYPCVVLSGRAQDDLVRRLEGVPLRQVIGNHGLASWRGAADVVGLVQTWRDALTEKLGGRSGVVIEDTGVSLAVHYRHARPRIQQREDILAAARDLPQCRIVGGQEVVNLVPEAAPHKGVAVETARDGLGCDLVLYLGDDDTDEDVFAFNDPRALVGVRVGRRELSRAAFYVRGQDEVDQLLRTALALRRGPCAVSRASHVPEAARLFDLVNALGARIAASTSAERLQLEDAAARVPHWMLRSAATVLARVLDGIGSPGRDSE